MKKSIAENNQNHIRQIEQYLGSLAGMLDAKDSYPLEESLLNEMKLLSPEFKKENSDILQPLHLYFIALYSKGRISLDLTAENPTISLFTDYFISRKNSIFECFEKDKLQKVILTLILANLSIHRVQHADQILSGYIGIFTEDYKAMLYMRILNASCGILDAEYIKDLFRQSCCYYEQINSITSKAEYLYKLYYLSKGTLIDNPFFDELLNDFAIKSKGVCNGKIRNVYREFLLNREYISIAESWIGSVNDVELSTAELAGITELRNMISQIKKGSERIRSAVTAKTEKNTEAFLNANIKRHYYDKEYSPEELLQDIKKGIEYYHKKTLTDDTLDKKLNALIITCELELMKPSVQFWAVQEKNYKKITAGENERNNDSVFIVVNEYSLVNASTTFPFLMEARRRGIPCYSFSSKLHLDSCDVNDPFYELYGMVDDGRDKRFLPDNDISDVEIDIRNKRIIVDGMNIYQPVFEIITRYQFTYEYRYETDAWARFRTVFLIRKYISLFNYIKDVEKWAKDNNKKVYFISNAPHIHNAAAFRIYCEEKGYQNQLYFICTSPGYDNYFLNSTDPRSLTTTALNMTTHLDSRNSFLGTREGFFVYYENNKYRISEIRKKMQDYLKARRGSRKRSFLQIVRKEKVLNMIRRARRQGKVIILVNGKVIIDLGVKYTKGCVHSDMSDWITHAVRFANENSDRILMIIKPHPHENRQDLTMTSEKMDNLRSIIKTDMGNVIYLDNDMFTNFELVPHIDLGMVWNGTSAIEFAAQGKKVLIADDWGHKDYPIGFVYPDTIEEYESYMTDPEMIREPEDIQDRAIAFLEYIGSDDVRVKNKYSQTTLMNFNQYQTMIDEAAVDEFVKNGDAHLKQYFDSIL